MDSGSFYTERWSRARRYYGRYPLCQRRAALTLIGVADVYHPGFNSPRGPHIRSRDRESTDWNHKPASSPTPTRGRPIRDSSPRNWDINFHQSTANRQPTLQPQVAYHTTVRPTIGSRSYYGRRYKPSGYYCIKYRCERNMKCRYQRFTYIDRCFAAYRPLRHVISFTLNSM